FFSSRRRHTRFSRDWSSDVCSSDLGRCNLPLYLGSTNTLPASAYSLSRFVKLKALTPKLFSKRKSPILIKNLSSAKMERLLIARSEEHTSELQSRENLVCRLLLEKK